METRIKRKELENALNLAFTHPGCFFLHFLDRDYIRKHRNANTPMHPHYYMLIPLSENTAFVMMLTSKIAKAKAVLFSQFCSTNLSKKAYQALVGNLFVAKKPITVKRKQSDVVLDKSGINFNRQDRIYTREELLSECDLKVIPIKSDVDELYDYAFENMPKSPRKNSAHIGQIEYAVKLMVQEKERFSRTLKQVEELGLLDSKIFKLYNEVVHGNIDKKEAAAFPVKQLIVAQTANTAPTPINPIKRFGYICGREICEAICASRGDEVKAFIADNSRICYFTREQVTRLFVGGDEVENAATLYHKIDTLPTIVTTTEESETLRIK